MEKPEYIIMGSIYKDRFEEALEGKAVLKTGFEIERENLEMMLK